MSESRGILQRLRQLASPARVVAFLFDVHFSDDRCADRRARRRPMVVVVIHRTLTGGDQHGRRRRGVEMCVGKSELNRGRRRTSRVQGGGGRRKQLHVDVRGMVDRRRFRQAELHIQRIAFMFVTLHCLNMRDVMIV